MKSLIAAVVAALLLCGIAFGEIPQVIGYQGLITDESGNPVGDGTYPIRFRIYDAESGGSVLWDTDDMWLPVSNGVFSVLLGEAGQPPLDLQFDQDYWILVTFDGEDQLPRKEFGSGGYAYMASGVVPGTEVTGSLPGRFNHMFAGMNQAASGWAIGLWGESASPSGDGVHGMASASSGPAYGGYFETSSTDGIGVYGLASATTGANYGVFGESRSTGGAGVAGLATASSGDTWGVQGVSWSTSGVGVYGWTTHTTGATSGVHGLNPSTSGKGVFGEASATSGTTSGVYGLSASSSGRGVYGRASATWGVTYGGRFETASSQSGAAGLYASGTYRGAEFQSGLGQGVYSYGLQGGGYFECGWGYGLYGVSNPTTGYSGGVWGETFSTMGEGVHGWARAASGATYGVYGQADSPSGFGVYYSGGLAGTGTKSCVVKTSKGPTLLYCQESPECWFEDVGGGQLANGKAHVELDAVFLETVTIDHDNPMRVFVELGGDCQGVYVVKGATGFDVRELQGGTSSVPFDYRVLAKRKGLETRRLDVCEAARRDPHLYPEEGEKRLRLVEEERVRMQRERTEIERMRMDSESERPQAERMQQELARFQSQRALHLEEKRR